MIPIFSLAEFLQVAHDYIWKIELWEDKFWPDRIRGLKITFHDETVHYYHKDGITAEDPSYPEYYVEPDER